MRSRPTTIPYWGNGLAWLYPAPQRPESTDDLGRPVPEPCPRGHLHGYTRTLAEHCIRGPEPGPVSHELKDAGTRPLSRGWPCRYIVTPDALEARETF
jgi:hypothetical protein